MRDIDLSDIPDVTEEIKPAPIDLSDIPDVTQEPTEEPISPQVDEPVMALPGGGVMPEEREEIIPPSVSPSLAEKAIKIGKIATIGTAETALALASPLLTWPAGKLSGLVHSVWGGEAARAAEEDVMNKGYQPVTPEGQKSVELVGKLFHAGLWPARKAGEELTKMGYPRLGYYLETIGELAIFQAAGGIRAKIKARGRPKIKAVEKPLTEEMVADIPDAKKLAPESEFLQKEFGERFIKPAEKAKLPPEVAKKAPRIEVKPKEVVPPPEPKFVAEKVKKEPAKMTPEWNKVHGMMAQDKKAFEWSGILGKTETKLFDRFAILRGKSKEAYESARTFSAYKDQAQIKFNELQEALKSVRGEEKLFTDYIAAHRAQTRAARGLKNPNKVTLEDANKAINAMETDYVSRGGNIKDLKAARDSFKKWTHDYILKEARDSGIISQASYADIVKNNKWYATFDVLERLPENLHDIPSLPSKEYFSVANQGIIKKMLGTEKKIADPIEATIRKFMQAQATFARNKVANTLIDDSAMKPFLRPVAGSAKEYGIMKNQGLNPAMEGAWSKKEFGTINRFKDGMVEKYLAPIEIAESMKQLTPWQAPRVIQALNNIFRKSATSLYLPFTISNSMRDALMAYTTSPVYKTTGVGKFAKDWTKGFWEGAKHEFLGSSDLAKTYIKSGGGFGYVGNLRQASLAKHGLFKKGMVRTAADIVTSPFQLIEKISATIELAPRLGVFQRAKMLKISNADAALIARQSTIDFNRGGTYTKVVNQFVPFLNARVQGRVVLASALKRDPKSTASKVFLAATIPGLAAYAWNRLYHSDLYDDIPEYVKQNYFCVITGSEKDKRTEKTVPKYLVISKGDVGQIAWNPIEFGLDKMWEKDQEGTGAFLVNYLSDLSPVEFARKGKISASKTFGGLLPPIVKGFAEDWANLNLYTGYEIVPYYMGKTKPPELQYREWTPETYKKLGRLLKISPERIKNFAGNIVAGYGREGLNPASMLRGLTGRLMRSQGGEIENRAWIAIKDIEQGYIYTRAYIEEFIKAGDMQEVVPLVHKWNTGLKDQIKEFNDQFEKYGLKDKGSLLASYLITEEKVNSAIMAVERRKQPGTTLEKKLLLQPKKTEPESIDLSDIPDIQR